ncbi:MAG: hypothetical protein MI919_20290 [Holophagales bacterium]|nr:hypothetical protein [Holophagales bacterium]
MGRLWQRLKRFWARDRIRLSRWQIPEADLPAEARTLGGELATGDRLQIGTRRFRLGEPQGPDRWNLLEVPAEDLGQPSPWSLRAEGDRLLLEHRGGERIALHGADVLHYPAGGEGRLLSTPGSRSTSAIGP